MNYTENEIREMFDLNPDMTLAGLAIITGQDVEELKQILMG